MTFGEMGIELAKQRADDLRDEVRRAGLSRRTRGADRRPARLQARAERLVHWFQHGQLGTGVGDLSEAPLVARGRCA